MVTVFGTLSLTVSDELINNCNVIASGGISKIEDVGQVKKINPFGVILGKALYEGLVSIEEAKKIDVN